MYNNEEGVGAGILAAGVKREESFVTTKLWNAAQGTDSVLKAFEQSLKRLQLDYVDLYLILWPAQRKGLYVNRWRTMMPLKEEGRVRTIGVRSAEGRGGKEWSSKRSSRGAPYH